MVIKVNVPWFVVSSVAALITFHILVAIHMHMSMEWKGYARGKIHTIGLMICILFGLFGCLYVALLPDQLKEAREEQKRKLQEMLEKRRQEIPDSHDK